METLPILENHMFTAGCRYDAQITTKSMDLLVFGYCETLNFSEKPMWSLSEGFFLNDDDIK